MSEELYSSSWYRVANLRPRLRGHVRIHRHHYRGERWYVLEDRVSRRMHRFNPPAHFVIGLMDGTRSVQELWDAAIARFGDDAPTQDELIRLLGQLHAADVLQVEVAPDVAELLRRAQTVRRRNLMQKLSPLALRMLKGALNAVTDGAAGMQQFAGDATLLFYMSEEAQEGRDAYVQKRPPDFARFPRRP